MPRGAPVPHQVYRTEQHGDTVVLKPRGDAAGFSLHTVSTEMAHVRDLIQSGTVRNLLVDLGGDRYFGSMVLGDLIELAQLARSRGGRTGICETSEDMSSILRLMQLNDQWEQFGTRAQGLQALASIPVKERLWEARYPIAATVAGVVLLAVYLWLPRPDYGQEYHAKLNTLWREVTATRPQVGMEEWRHLSKRTKVQLDPVINHLESRVRNKQASQSEKYLLIATKYHWVPWLSDTDVDEIRDRQLVQFYLDMAHATATRQPLPANPMEALAVQAQQKSAPVDVSDSQTSAGESSSAILPVSGVAEEPVNVAPPETSQGTEPMPKAI